MPKIYDLKELVKRRQIIETELMIQKFNLSKPFGQMNMTGIPSKILETAVVPLEIELKEIMELLGCFSGVEGKIFNE